MTLRLSKEQKPLITLRLKAVYDNLPAVFLSACRPLALQHLLDDGETITFDRCQRSGTPASLIIENRGSLRFLWALGWLTNKNFRSDDFWTESRQTILCYLRVLRGAHASQKDQALEL